MVEVEPDTIRKLAEYLRYTDSAGHAAWHLYAPEIPVPCSLCEKREPVESLNLNQCTNLAYDAACMLSNF